jgi:hypothetical protein
VIDTVDHRLELRERDAGGLALQVVWPLLYCGAALLFLSAAATVDVGFTVRVSQVLLGVACAVGAATVVEGWRRLPFVVVLGATGVLGAYVLAAALGDDQVLQGTARGGAHRELVYLADLVLGLAVVGLVVGATRSRRHLRRLAVALAIGAALAGGYAIYQWFAQQHGWPLADAVNTADSNGVTRGGLQGDGFLGHERARGTFLEPHFLGTFLASLLPVVVALLLTVRRPAKVLLGLTAAAILFASLLTSSVPSWAVLLVGVAAGAVLWAVSRRSAVAVTAAVLAVLLASLLTTVSFRSPETLSGLTGRSGDQMRLTTSFRTTTWHRVGDIWSTRPVLGYGPGQSSVQLTADGDFAGVAADSRHRAGLQSAQGLWAASLIDAGVVGLAMWLVLFCGVLGVAFAAARARPSPLLGGVALAALTAVVGSQVAGDRLDLRVWVLLGLALAAATHDQQPQRD